VASPTGARSSGRLTEKLLHHFGVDELAAYPVLRRAELARVPPAEAAAEPSQVGGEPLKVRSADRGRCLDATPRPGPASLKMLLAVHGGRVVESAGPVPGRYVFADRAAYLWIAHLNDLGLVAMPTIGPPRITDAGKRILRAAGLIA
jgi:hypothetical protein